MISDEELVRRAQQGDKSAFDTLFARHRPRILRYCIRLLTCEPEAEQVTQDTFVLAWTHLSGFYPDAPFEHWLIHIATNSCRNLLRTKKGLAALNGPRWEDPKASLSMDSALPFEPGVDEAVIQSVTAKQWLKTIRQYTRTIKPIWDALDWQIFVLMFEQNVEEKREVARLLLQSEDKIKYRIYHHLEPTLRAVGRQLEKES
jgi:RNA polymerase sigma factor (sigma-70 family)